MAIVFRLLNKIVIMVLRVDKCKVLHKVRPQHMFQMLDQAEKTCQVQTLQLILLKGQSCKIFIRLTLDWAFPVQPSLFFSLNKLFFLSYSLFSQSRLTNQESEPCPPILFGKNIFVAFIILPIMLGRNSKTTQYSLLDKLLHIKQLISLDRQACQST